MAVWEIVLLILVVLLALLFAGGYVANARANDARQRRLRQRVAEADQMLAAARANDRGWDRSLLEQAARTAVHARRPGAEIEQIELVQVIDLPGTDSDSAVFHVVTSSGEEQLEMVRNGDAWSAA